MKSLKIANIVFGSVTIVFLSLFIFTLIKDHDGFKIYGIIGYASLFVNSILLIIISIKLRKENKS